MKVQHDYKNRTEDQPKQMGKGMVYLIIAITVANALFIMPAFYILS